MPQGYRKDGTKLGFQHGNKHNLGRKFPKDHCNNISIARKGYVPTLKHRKNLSKAGKGRIAWNKGIEWLSMRKQNAPGWKGGIIDINGYCYVYREKHPFKVCGHYIKRSRLIAEAYLGRFLTKKEVVHHINKNKKDDRIENFIVFDNNGSHLNYEIGRKVDKKHIILDGRIYGKKTIQ